MLPIFVMFMAFGCIAIGGFESENSAVFVAEKL